MLRKMWKTYKAILVTLGLLLSAFPVMAGGIDSASGTDLPISAGGTTALTLKAGSQEADFAGIVSAPRGVNVTGAGNAVLYPTGDAWFSGTATIGGTTTIGGNVGIGITSPQAALDITTPVGTDGITTVPAIHTMTSFLTLDKKGNPSNRQGNIWLGGSGDMVFDGGDDSLFWFMNKGAIGGGSAFWWGGDATHSAQANLYIGNSGNVGIGTTTPLWQLEVASSSNHAVARLSSPSTMTSTLQLYTDDSSGWALGKSQNGGNFFLNYDSPQNVPSLANVLAATPSGNVGIGTQSPSGTLDVENSSGNATFCLNGNCVSSMAQLDGKNGTNGATGATGATGCGVSSSSVNSSSHLILTWDANCGSKAGTTTDVGNVQGLQGTKGDKGDTGDTGLQGPAGSGGIYTTGANCDDNACRYANPKTGGCSCPSGYSAHEFWEYVSATAIYADGNSACFNSNHWVRVYQCTN